MAESARSLPARPSLEQLRKQAKERLHQRRGADPSATLAQVQFALAREYGFDSWPKLVRHVEALIARLNPTADPHGLSRTPPFYRIDWHTDTLHPLQPLTDRDWDRVIDVMRDLHVGGLEANGQMTDAALARLAALDHVTRLNVENCPRLTDEGVQALARMPQLDRLTLGGGQSSLGDRGLTVLGQLPALRHLQLCWTQRATDAGVAHLAACDRVEEVDLMGTPAGDGALAALAGKSHLRRLKCGTRTTDAGLPRLHEIPAFRLWQGGEPTYSLMSADAGPTNVLLDGPITDAGLASLAGLDGLFGLGFFWHAKKITSTGLAPLATLPHLGFLACEGKLCDDRAMHHIGSMPRLRMLMGQGTVGTDAGFAALARSQTIEYLWGRECPRLTGAGFRALASMPSLRGLAVSCKRVDDASLSALPRFPMLRELMPMDVDDAGFRHVGQCTALEGLWCMYCRDTGDAATEHLAGLARLKTYYAGKTRITDRSLERLSDIDALETIELWQTVGVTDDGVRALGRLPHLRELMLDGLPRVTRDALSALGPQVHVRFA